MAGPWTGQERRRWSPPPAGRSPPFIYLEKPYALVTPFARRAGSRLTRHETGQVVAALAWLAGERNAGRLPAGDRWLFYPEGRTERFDSPSKEWLKAKLAAYVAVAAE